MPSQSVSSSPSHNSHPAPLCELPGKKGCVCLHPLNWKNLFCDRTHVKFLCSASANLLSMDFYVFFSPSFPSHIYYTALILESPASFVFWDTILFWLSSSHLSSLLALPLCLPLKCWCFSIVLLPLSSHLANKFSLSNVIHTPYFFWL